LFQSWGKDKNKEEKGKTTQQRVSTTTQLWERNNNFDTPL
jgi:hypothetical protein